MSLSGFGHFRSVGSEAELRVVNKCGVGWYVVIAIEFPKGGILGVVDLGRTLKEWDVMGNRKVFEEKGTAHKDNFEAGVSISTWGDTRAGKQ